MSNDPQSPPSFEDELTAILNSHSVETMSGTPDFILAEFMVGCLKSFNTAVRRGAEWDSQICSECGEHRPEDERVSNGMKCGPCASAGVEP